MSLLELEQTCRFGLTLHARLPSISFSLAALPKPVDFFRMDRTVLASLGLGPEFLCVINLNTAKSLSLEVLLSLLAQADEVI